MKKTATKASLSPERKRLLKLMQQVNFGRIENLVICGGKPVFKPAPRIFREIKFSADNGPRRELAADDFLLKSQVLDLYAHLTRLGDGRVESLDVKNGLPFRMIIEEKVTV